VHAAARAHVLRETAPDPLQVFRAVNTLGTITLARQAAESGVRRFVFLSSIGVNGDRSDRPFAESDEPNPREAYAISKLEAENGLWAIARETGMQVVILRPPLVYGANAPGNIGRLAAAVLKGTRLPLGAVTSNRRTFLALDNLTDVVATCVAHPAAAGQVFLAGDSEDLSTADLLRRMALAFEAPLRMLPVPVWILRAGGAALGRRTTVRSLCDSLQVDTSKARDLLGWRPLIGVDEGLRRMAQRSLRDQTP
ncbi:MAG: nucleoside-diphosphate sugar epimerase, partial [Actinobacteria bacterium RBG_16_64_13]